MTETKSEVSAPDRLTFLAAAVVIFLGGGNAVGIRFVVQELDPFWGAAMRFGLAAAIFLAFVAVRRLALPRGRALTGVVLYGVLSFGGAFAFGFWGLVRVEAGLAMLILSLVPLITLFLAAAHGLEALSSRGVFGALAAVAGFGVIFLLDDRDGQTISMAGVAAVFAAAVAISEAGVIVKRFPKVNPAVENGLAMAVGTGVLLVLSLISGEVWAIPRQGDTVAAMAYLILGGSVVVFALFIFILSRWTASAASYQFVLTPFITLPVAAWLLGERLSATMLVGAVVVVAGVYAAALHPTRPKEATIPAQCGPDVMIRQDDAELAVEPTKA